MPTNFSLSITLIIQDQPVIISSASFDTFVFTLSRPIDFGTWNTFTQYLHENWNVNIQPLPQTGVPALDRLYKDLTGDVHLQLTTLTYNKPAQYFEFGVSLEADPPEELVTGLKFKAAGVNVRVQPESFKLTGDLQPGADNLALPATVDLDRWIKAERIFIMSAASETIAVDPPTAADKRLKFTHPAASAQAHAKDDLVMLVGEKQTPA